MILLRPEPVTFTRLVDAAAVDGRGRLVLPFIEVLAVARLRVTDDILLVELTDESSIALTVREALGPGAPALVLDAGYRTVALLRLDGGERAGAADPVAVRAIHAMSFGEFVGRRR